MHQNDARLNKFGLKVLKINLSENCDKSFDSCGIGRKVKMLMRSRTKKSSTQRYDIS